MTPEERCWTAPDLVCTEQWDCCEEHTNETLEILDCVVVVVVVDNHIHIFGLLDGRTPALTGRLVDHRVHNQSEFQVHRRRVDDRMLDDEDDCNEEDEVA